MENNKNSYLDKHDKLIVVFVLILALLLSSIVLVLYMTKKNEEKSNLDTSLYQTTVITEEEDNTQITVPDISFNVTVGDSEGEEVSEKTTVPVDNNTAKSKKQLVDEYVNALNKLKNTDNFSLQMSSFMNIQVNEITGGRIAEKILQSFVNDANKSENYQFVNGFDSTRNETPNSILPPANTSVTLSDKDVVSADVIYAEDGYTVKFVLCDERVTTNGSPQAHTNCLPNLDTDMGDSSLKIESYDVLFSGSTITARYDNSGRLLYIEHIARSPGMTCEGSAVISLYVSIYGNITTSYTITY